MHPAHEAGMQVAGRIGQHSGGGIARRRRRDRRGRAAAARAARRAGRAASFAIPDPRPALRGGRPCRPACDGRARAARSSRWGRDSASGGGLRR
jgi:hypothetical protein